MKLLVVAGHGKLKSGTMDNGSSGNGYNEAERVRALANRMKALGGNSVILGDQSKKWLDYKLYDTVNKSTFDCAIELHMDSAGASAKGGHVIIKTGFKADIYDKALENFIKGYFPGRYTTLDARNDLGAIKACASRGINFRLLEVCFITNNDDITKFNSNIDTVAKGILSAFGISATPTAAAPTSGFRYQGHVQDIGWQNYVPAGGTAGVTGQAKRLEAIRIDPYGMEIYAKAHIQGKGWVDYGKITKDTVIGTVGQSNRLECLLLKGNIEYRVHVQGAGWTAWTKADGVATLGTVGQALRIEAIQIRKA